MSTLRRIEKMTTGITAIQANAVASGSFLNNGTSGISSSRILQISQPSTAAQTQQTRPAGDTVQLSDTAQQYLQSSQTQATQAKSLVERLVQAAASGDSGALSLLTVI